MNLIALQKNQVAFIQNLDPLVALIEFQHAIMMFYDWKNSCLVLSLLSFLILFYEVAVPMVPWALAVFMLFNKYSNGKFQRWGVNYVKNMRCVQMQTDQIATGTKSFYWVMEKIFYWED